MRKRSLYKFVSDRRWAAALIEGEVFFNSLAYFRDYEDAGVRSDINEGASVYTPSGGLVVNNVTQGRSMTLPGHTFTSTAKQDEIFVFCVSRAMTDRLKSEFKAVACVEITDVAAFCRRVQEQLPGASFPGRPGRTHIGHPVTYYRPTEAGHPRWAAPDLIATSKLDSYSWQHEYRFVFSVTDALAFQNVSLTLLQKDAPPAQKAPRHANRLVKIGSLRDIAVLHEL